MDMAQRPLREEILQTFEGSVAGEPAAMLTRNGYGAQVLNTATQLFLDVDLPPVGFWRRVLRLFGVKPAVSEDTLLAGLRDVLGQYGGPLFGFTELRPGCA